MPLPAFNAEGLLPDGVHPATEDELKERCVDPFRSMSRNKIFQGLCRYRAELAALGVCATQWVDGSFVDQKRRDPEDVDLVDLVNFCDQANINSLPGSVQQRVGEIIGAGEKTIRSHKCHTFVVMKYPHGHPMASKFEEKRRYWRDWYAMPQEYTPTNKVPAPHRGRKGFISMIVGPAANAPNVSTNA